MTTSGTSGGTAIAPATGLRRSRRYSGAYDRPAPAAQAAQQGDEARGVERVGRALAVGPPDPLQLGLRQVEPVHRHDDGARVPTAATTCAASVDLPAPGAPTMPEDPRAPAGEQRVEPGDEVRGQRHRPSSSAIVPGSASATARRRDRAAGVGPVRRAAVHQRGRRRERGRERRVLVDRVDPAGQQRPEQTREHVARRPRSRATPARPPARTWRRARPTTTVTGPLSSTVAPVSSCARRAQRSGSASTAARSTSSPRGARSARELAGVRRQHRVRADVLGQQLERARVDDGRLAARPARARTRTRCVAAGPASSGRDARSEHPGLHAPVADDDLGVRGHDARHRRRPGSGPCRRRPAAAALVARIAAPG